jgi:hypothetical protein
MDDASHQLAEEIRWLRGDVPGSMLELRKDHRLRLTSIAQTVEDVLQRPELRKFLAVLGRHNRGPERVKRDRQRASFLMSPYLLHAISSVDARGARC